jgi:hypothetical protein
MSLAAATYDSEHPTDDDDRRCITAARALDYNFDQAEHEKFKTGRYLLHSTIQGEISQSEVDGHITCRIVANIRAPINYAMGYACFHNQQYWDVMNSLTAPDTIAERAFDRTGRHHYNVFQLEAPFPLTNREYVTISSWEKMDDGVFLWGAISTTHADVPETPEFVRMTVSRSMKMEALSPSLTRLTITSELDLGGSVPRWINDAITVPQLAGTALNMMNYFAAVRSPDSYDTGDAHELGRLSFVRLYPLRHRREVLRAEVAMMIAHNDAMREFQAKYNFLCEMLFAIIRNKLSEVGSSKVTTRAMVLTGSEATSIANTFSAILLTNVTSDAAVQEWIVASPALRELEEEFSWFTPMFEGIAGELLAATPFGVKLRAYSGAALSFLDIASDSYIIVDMYIDGRVGFARVLLAMIAINLFVQLLVAWGQTNNLKKNRSQTMVIEAVYVLTFIKPG